MTEENVIDVKRLRALRCRCLDEHAPVHWLEGSCDSLRNALVWTTW